MITEILLTLWHKKGENMAVTANVVNGQLDSKYTTPKSSTKEDSNFTSFSSTPNWSTIIALTLSNIILNTS